MEEGGNLDIPPPLLQLGFSAYESTGLSLFAREGGGGTPQLHVFNKTATAEETRQEAKVKPERRSFSPLLSVSRPLR